jgi:hypothetical protein
MAKKWCAKMSGFVLLRIGFSSVLLQAREWTFGFHKRRIYWHLKACQERLLNRISVERYCTVTGSVVSSGAIPILNWICLCRSPLADDRWPVGCAGVSCSPAGCMADRPVHSLCWCGKNRAKERDVSLRDHSVRTGPPSPLSNAVFVTRRF